MELTWFQDLKSLLARAWHSILAAMAKQPGIDIPRHDSPSEPHGSLQPDRSWQWERLAISGNSGQSLPMLRQQETPPDQTPSSDDSRTAFHRTDTKFNAFSLTLGRIPGKLSASESSKGAGSILNHLRHSSSQRKPRRPSRSTSKAAEILMGRISISRPLDREMDEGFEFGKPGATFRLGRTIGAGGSSVVFEAYALDENNKKVAVKVTRPNSTDLGNEHKHEADIWKQLPQHPHLLALLYHEKRIITDGNSDNQKTREFIVMELSHYGNLLRLIRVEGTPTGTSLQQEQSDDTVTSPLSSSRHSSLNLPKFRGISLQQTRDIMQQLASALYCLHKVAHVVHNDLKLENILGFPSEDESKITWKVADFGLAECVVPQDDPSNVPPTPCGTIEYIAPEMVRYLDTDMEIFDTVPSHAKPLPPPDLSPYARDMWALGCILYALCTGSLPFTDAVQSRLLQRISDGEYEVPYGLLTYSERTTVPAEDFGNDIEDTDEHREQAREVLEHLLDVDPYTRWDIENLCQSRWLNM